MLLQGYVNVIKAIEIYKSIYTNRLITGKGEMAALTLRKFLATAPLPPVMGTKLTHNA